MSRQPDDLAALDRVDPREYYTSYRPPHHDQSPRVDQAVFATPTSSVAATPSSTAYTHDPPGSFPRSISRSPTRAAYRAASQPTQSPSAVLSNSKSQSNFASPARPPQRSFKDLVNRFNVDATAGERPVLPPTPAERHRRAREQRPTKLTKPRSPTKPSHSRGHVKLQTRKEPPRDRIPMGKLDTATASNTSRSADSLNPFAASTSPTRRKMGQPLFGEVVFDHNGASDLGYGIPSQYHVRRGSDSDLHTPSSYNPHGRGQSRTNNSFDQPPIAPDANERMKKHMRSQSDLSPASYTQAMHHDFKVDPSRPSPFINASQAYQSPQPPHASNPSNLPTALPQSPTSPGRAAAKNYFPTPKSSSGPGHRMPFRQSPGQQRINTPAVQTPPHRRYEPPTRLHDSSGPTLRAYINAPLPQKSPPLRSSRPRQPVSMASTAASRARAAEKQETRDRGMSLDAASRPRQRKKIPELGRVDFAERRARIERAISLSIEEQDLKSTRSSSGHSARRHTLEQQADRTEDGVVHFDGTATAPEPLRPPDQQGDAGVPPLQVDTHQIYYDASDEPTTAGTEFEEDDTPVFVEKSDVPSFEISRDPSIAESTQAQTGASPPPSRESDDYVHHRQSLLDSVMQMRERSSSRESRSNMADDASDFTRPEDGGSIRIMLDGEDYSQTPDHSEPEPVATSEDRLVELIEGDTAEVLGPPAQYSEQDHPIDPEDDVMDSSPETPRKPPSIPLSPTEDIEHTPRQITKERKPPTITAINTEISDDKEGQTMMQRLIDDYEQGRLAPEALEKLQHRVSVLYSDSSKTGASDAMTIQVLLDTVSFEAMDSPQSPEKEEDLEPLELLSSAAYKAPEATPRTTGLEDDKDFANQHHMTIEHPDRQLTVPAVEAIDFGRDPPNDTHSHQEVDSAVEPESELASKSEMEFDSELESESDMEPDMEAEPNLTAKQVQPELEPEAESESQPGLELESRVEPEAELEQLSSMSYEPPQATTGAERIFNPPTPPPKDSGYSPRASRHYSLSPSFRAPSPPSARLSKLSDFQFLPEIEVGSAPGLGLNLEAHVNEKLGNMPPPSSRAPDHPPPPPPSPRAPDHPPPPTSLSAPIQHQSGHDIDSAGQQSVPVSARSSVAFLDPSRTSSITLRTSTDSPRPEVPPLPQSQSMSSMSQESILRKPLANRGSPVNADEPNSVQRRLIKRRNIIKELVDTEYSYHQDMKIIEDIYKATVADLITVDDKKILFGNSDQVEAFSLEFYDALRRAVAPFYIPPKSSRWQPKRNSYSTSNSGNTEQSTIELPDEEKDRKTVVGESFVQFLPRMEKVYGTYLKNHDYANQRLSKLQTDVTVKCWLTECHSNASDITSAWDLDSLLVKPVQRILKYPLLLQQLLETTPSDHPDHASLDAAVKESMNISHRINEAKKRADLVEQIVNRKRKDSDVRSGIAKAFGRRTEKLKERVGIAEAFQDAEFDELAHKFGGHFIRLQVCMRDVQGSLIETDKAVERFNGFASALEAYIEIGLNSYPEIESKWRKYVLAIRELTVVALADHKAQIKRRVIDPMVMAIKLHEGPQNAITKRKKRIIDYARCKAMEKRGEKPDKKIIEASEMYEALNDQLKIDLPKLYSLTAELIQNCLGCHIQIQRDWLWTWEMKLRPVLDTFPQSIGDIPLEFDAEYEMIHAQVLSLGLCNGALISESASFLSPQSTLVGDDPFRRTAPRSGSSRTLSVGSEQSPVLHPEQARSHSGSTTQSPMPLPTPDAHPLPNGYLNGRMRSSSSLSNRGRSHSYQGNNGTPAPRMPSQTPKPSFSHSRPPSARPADLNHTPSYNNRSSVDAYSRSPVPGSGASYSTAQQEPVNKRYSGMFSSALPPSEHPAPTSHPHHHQQQQSQQQQHYQPHQYLQHNHNQYSSTPASPKHAPEDMPVMFVAASLFEFNIDRARREAGYSYLTYVQGEVFDVVAQKGELWLAKNQDDGRNELGWIWEQHFVILSQDAS